MLQTIKGNSMSEHAIGRSPGGWNKGPAPPAQGMQAECAVQLTPWESETRNHREWLSFHRDHGDPLPRSTGMSDSF